MGMRMRIRWARRGAASEKEIYGFDAKVSCCVVTSCLVAGAEKQEERGALLGTTAGEEGKDNILLT
jgi:hypothetical protein